MTEAGHAEERKATWLELFFDLVFVAAITVIGSELAHQKGLWGIAAFIALFIPIWWAWVGHTVYANRFPKVDRPHRILTLLMMFAAAGMAVQLGRIEESGGLGFVVAYCLARVALLLLYARQGGQEDVRYLRSLYLRGFGLGAAVWLISLLFPPPVRYGLWVLGMLIDLATPWLGRAGLQRTPLHVAHLPERMGLFTLILLGESIVVVVDKISHVSLTTGPVTVAVLAFAVAVSIWWNYFSFVEVTRFECRLGSGQPYIYTHLPLAIGLTSLAAGIKRALTESDLAAFTQPTLILLGLGATLWFLGMLSVKLVSYEHRHGSEALWYAGATLAAILLMVMGGTVPPMILFGLLALVFVLPAVVMSRPTRAV
jgi:low temperature requirement protein LtrA